ncbi:hypothetical protein CBR_g17697 [Chara braunii]|uniref:Uncharacterized protein n=1 Tax=Chara braunii TaxID=69332 RepID=A0A388KV98_CHABU|nr:hypothetical protein CBR_g17697 [Chara braunii]|eukprot:GBG73986.1 hypothetical protein CBR_g17697 [Chara braunii]
MSRVQVLCRLGSQVVVPRGRSRLGFVRPNLASRTCAGHGGRVVGPPCRPRMMSTAGEAAPGSASQAKKGGGGGRVIALLGLAAIGAGGYYYYDTQMGLGGGGILPSPQTKQDGNTETSAAAPAESSTIPSPLALHPPLSSSSDSAPLAKSSSPLSPREDLLNRQAEMKAQLEELRKKGKKRDPIIDLQKKEIKDDLKIVAKLLKQLEKGA